MRSDLSNKVDEYLGKIGKAAMGPRDMPNPKRDAALLDVARELLRELTSHFIVIQLMDENGRLSLLTPEHYHDFKVAFKKAQLEQQERHEGMRRVSEDTTPTPGIS